MSRRRLDAKYDDLVLAIATGSTVKAWCESTHTPYNTAVKWFNTDEFRARVQEVRAKMLDAAIGKLTEAASEVAERMVALARDAKSETVQLTACREVLAGLINVSGFAQIKGQMAELHQQMARILEGRNGRVQPADGETGVAATDDEG
jgi:hypothetical protein